MENRYDKKDILPKQYRLCPKIQPRDMTGCFSDLFEAIDALMKGGISINVGIDGNSGAGKSTLARLLGEIYHCNIFRMDDFFLRPELKTKERLEEVGGNVDYLRFRQEVIDGLNSGQVFGYRPYDCKTMSLEEWIWITPKKLNIIEGVYSMHPTLADNYHLKVFLQVDEEVQSRRILERNGPLMHKRFIKEWIPMENEYFDKMGIREKCDLVYKI